MLISHSSLSIALPLFHVLGQDFQQFSARHDCCLPGEDLVHQDTIDFRISVGQPFTLKTCGEKLSHLRRQKITDEIMFQVAALLPPNYRGYYSDQSLASFDCLEYVSLSDYHPVPA